MKTQQYMKQEDESNDVRTTTEDIARVIAGNKPLSGRWYRLLDFLSEPGNALLAGVGMTTAIVALALATIPEGKNPAISPKHSAPLEQRVRVPATQSPLVPYIAPQSQGPYTAPQSGVAPAAYIPAETPKSE